METVSTQQALKRISAAKTVVLYGASSSGLRVLSNLRFCSVFTGVEFYFFDSNREKWTTNFGGLKVLTENEYLEKVQDENALTVITSSVVDQISQALEERSVSNVIFAHGLIYTDKLFDKFPAEFLEVYEKIRGVSNIDADELFSLYSSAVICRELPGAVAEIGVYRGGSSYLLSKVLPEKKIFLCDTFEGLPEDGSKTIQNEPSAGWLSDTDVNSVLEFVSQANECSGNIECLKGYFPDETSALIPEDEKFCLVHLDTDRYASTKSALEFFYPRLCKGGRILLHDYNCFGTPGVKKAVQEFTEKNGIGLFGVEIAESQYLLIKPFS